MEPKFLDVAIVPHESITGVDCVGCIVAAVKGDTVELFCKECRAVVGTVQADIFRGLLQLEGPKAKCPKCGRLNVFPGFSKVVI